MDDLADCIKTKSLTEALEPLTEQVLEISSLTLKDLNDLPKSQDILLQLSAGMKISTQQFCDILDRKIRNLNPSINKFNCLKELIDASEDISSLALQLVTIDQCSLDLFQEKIAKFLELMLKVVLLWDQEVISSFQQMISILRKPLIGLGKTNSILEIISLYREFTEQFKEFGEHLCRRINDLVDRKIQNEFWIHLSCIHQLAISFAPAIKNIARFPMSKHCRTSKEFLLKELLFFLEELDGLLNLDQPSKANQYASSFLNYVDDVLERLDGGHLDDEDLDWKITQILEHSMTVSKFSAEQEKAQIIRHSQQVLNEFRSLQQSLKKMEQCPADISLAVDILRDFLELLEQDVNHSLLIMMVENLSISEEPLRALMDRCPIREGEVAERFITDLSTEVNNFDQTMERVLQTGYFALASTGDHKKIQDIRCALYMLESLEAEIVPAIYTCYLSHEDEAAEIHLQFLWRNFHEQISNLQSSLDSIADPVVFCHVAEVILIDHISTLRKDLYSQDVFLLGQNSRLVISITSRCVALLKSQEWIQIQGEKIFLSEIKQALGEFKGATVLTLQNISNLRNHRSMIKRAEILLKYLIKCIDCLKQLQDSELENSLSVMCETELPRYSRMNSCDLTNISGNVQGKAVIDKNKIGYTPSKKKKQDNPHELERVDVVSQPEMTRFINTTQPWRTRFIHLTPEDEEETVAERESPKLLNFTNSRIQENTRHVETFDLTDLLEQLTTLEGTLTSNQSITLPVPKLVKDVVAISSKPTNNLLERLALLRRLSITNSKKKKSQLEVAHT